MTRWKHDAAKNERRTPHFKIEQTALMHNEHRVVTWLGTPWEHRGVLIISLTSVDKYRNESARKIEQIVKVNDCSRFVDDNAINAMMPVTQMRKVGAQLS